MPGLVHNPEDRARAGELLDREIARWKRIYKDHELASMRDRALYTLEALKTVRKELLGDV